MTDAPSGLLVWHTAEDAWSVHLLLVKGRWSLLGLAWTRNRGRTSNGFITLLGVTWRIQLRHQPYHRIIPEGDVNAALDPIPSHRLNLTRMDGPMIVGLGWLGA